MIFGHVLPLALTKAAYDVAGIVSGIIAFVTS